MKFLFDYFPIICFFIAYKFFGIYVATAATMGASLLQVGFYWLVHRSFEKLHVITMILILVLGSLTLFLHDAIFIKWKPSIIYWLFAIVLFGSQLIGKKPLIHHMLGDKIQVPKKVWQHVTFSWGVFFVLMGFLNLYVVFNYSTNSWVYFKLFGTLGLTLLFIFFMALYISRYMQPDKKTSNQAKE